MGSTTTSSFISKRWYLILLIVIPLLFSGCSEDGEDDEHEDDDAQTELVQGWHFPGRDCLACHNIDLQNERHLTMAGTLYKSSAVTDVDDLSQVCEGDFVVQFLDASYATQIASTQNEDQESKGYKGKGNIFMLSRQNNPLTTSYYIRIVDRDTGITVLQSPTHNFNGNDYNVNLSTDLSNTVSCNSCHRTGGLRSPLAVNDSTICK